MARPSPKKGGRPGGASKGGAGGRGGTRRKSMPGKPSHRMPTMRQRSAAAKARRQSPTGEDQEGDFRLRLQRVLAQAGLGSRRACEEYITTGRVEVDGAIVTQLGVRVDPFRQEIRFDGEPLKRPRLVTLAVAKPRGYVCTNRDPQGRPRVVDLVPERYGRLFPVGRLDLNSEGLILLTNDGELANRITHPRFGVEKIYRVQVAGDLKRETLEELRKGIHLAEGLAKVTDAKIKGRHKNSTILEMILDEGKNREIRRVLARVGHKVMSLMRIAVGPVRLAKMAPGEHRRLTNEEMAQLRRMTHMTNDDRKKQKKPTGGSTS